MSELKPDQSEEIRKYIPQICCCSVNVGDNKDCFFHSSKVSELKVCPFCGESELSVNPFIGQQGKGSYEETHRVICNNCVPDMASINEWNNAYCWKEIDALKSALAKANEEIKELKKRKFLTSPKEPQRE